MIFPQLGNTWLPPSAGEEETLKRACSALHVPSEFLTSPLINYPGLQTERKDNKTMSKLAIYDSDSEIVIAESPEDAQKVCEETGIQLTPEDWAEYEWTRIEGAKSYSFRPDDGGPLVTKTADEWIAERGRSYMGSYYA